MTGLDKIVNLIDAEASASADEIINSAETEAKKIIAQAKIDAENSANLIIKNAEDKAEFILKRAASLENLKEREMILDVKREQINYILDETKKYLRSLPVEEYFDLILKLCKKYISPSKGEIIFSAADLKRIPHDFQANLSKVAQTICAEITVSEQTRNINGGFILSYGDIEENCSFDALFESNFDLLSDKVNEILFS